MKNMVLENTGAHGTSHKYVSRRIAELLGKDIKDLKIINCHLGQGASLCAIQNGECVDTSMDLRHLEEFQWDQDQEI